MQLLLFPCNGNTLEALLNLTRDDDVVGFIDDAPEKQGTRVGNSRVYSRDALRLFPQAKVIAAIGNSRSFLQRKKIIDGLDIPRDRFATLIHPTATISPMASIGYDVLIGPGVIITSNAVIGNHVCILPNTVIHHDVRIGAYTSIGSNVTVAGNVRIGENCYIGSGASIIENIRIGDKVLIGIGSTVIRSIPLAVKAVGNPARIIP